MNLMTLTCHLPQFSACAYREKCTSCSGWSTNFSLFRFRFQKKKHFWGWWI